MRVKLRQSVAPLIWLLLGGGVALWGMAVLTQLPSLTLSAPFLQLGWLFWIGLAITMIAFLAGQGAQRALAVGLLAGYFIATLGFIYPYGVMHDSIGNVLLFPGGEGYGRIYSLSYGGLGATVSWLERLGGFQWQDIARLFPVGLTPIYLLSIGLIVISWRDRIFSSSLSGNLFAFFFFAFGETFNLRVNASPQTIGFLAFLIALGLLPLSFRSLFLRVILLLALAAMIMSHPITPLLALPGLVVVASSWGEFSAAQIKRGLQFGGSFLVGYVTWTLYRADWLISGAVKVVLSAFQEEKGLPLVNSPVVPQIEEYVLFHRIFFIALLLVLVVGYLSLWRSRAWYLVTAWGISFIPGFVLLLGYHDFFDRILLFMLVPSAVVFAEAGERLCRHFPRLKVPAALLVFSLTMMSASVAYFWINAVDHVTQDEINAAQYLASLHRNLLVYSGGFSLPLSPDLKFIPAPRGFLSLEEAQRADAVVISGQLENAVLLIGQSPLGTTAFVTLLQSDYDQVYTSGQTQVFMKRPKEPQASSE